MSTYMEIKQLLKELLFIEYDIDETCDLLITPQSHEEENIVLLNDELKKAFEQLQKFSTSNLELSTARYREVALQWNRPMRISEDFEPITDDINGITYNIGLASLDYCMFLLDEIVEKAKTYGRRVYIDLRHKARILLRRNYNLIFQRILWIFCQNYSKYIL